MLPMEPPQALKYPLNFVAMDKEEEKKMRKRRWRKKKRRNMSGKGITHAVLAARSIRTIDILMHHEYRCNILSPTYDFIYPPLARTTLDAR